MRAGACDTPIEIQYLGTSSADSRTGRPLQNWLPLDVQSGSPTVAQYTMAQFLDALPSRDETVVQGVVVATKRATVTFRWRADVTSAMRLIRRDGTDEVYQITRPPAQLGRREWLQLAVESASS